MESGRSIKTPPQTTTNLSISDKFLKKFPIKPADITTTPLIAVTKSKAISDALPCKSKVSLPIKTYGITKAGNPINIASFAVASQFPCDIPHATKTATHTGGVIPDITAK